MTDSRETEQITRAIAHDAIRMQFDTGAMTINMEDPFEVLDRCADLIGHVHISEPDLVPIGDAPSDHRRMHAALHQYLGDALVTIEMLALKEDPSLAGLKRAATVTTRYYRPAI